MPRVGMTFKLNDLTVLRGGYGMFYGFLGQRRGDVIQSGFNQNTNIIPSLDNGLTFIGTLTNPFPNGISEPLGSAQGIATFLGQGITYFDPNPKSPRTQRWQVGVQRELPWRWTIEASYVGNYGSQLQTGRNLNATPNQYLSTSPVRDQTTINYLGANIPNPFSGLLPTTAVAGLQGTNITRERLLRPYPQFDSVNTTTNEGRVLVPRATAEPAEAVLERLHAGIQLHLLEVHRGRGVPQCRRSRALEGHFGCRRSASPDGQRHPRAAVRTRAPDRRRRQRRRVHVHQRLAGVGDLHLSKRLPAGVREHHFHRRPQRHSPVRERADGCAVVQYRRRIQQGVGTAARVERPHVPAAARERRDPIR